MKEPEYSAIQKRGIVDLFFFFLFQLVRPTRPSVVTCMIQHQVRQFMCKALK